MANNREARTFIAISTLFIGLALAINLIVSPDNAYEWSAPVMVALLLISGGFMAWNWTEDRRASRAEETALVPLAVPQVNEWIIPSPPIETESTVAPDDFTKIEGIGKAYSQKLVDAGVTTYAQLGDMSLKDLQKLLSDSGVKIIPPSVATWAEQAQLAAAGDWDKLSALQDELQGGVRAGGDDLTRIEGIGAVYAARLYDAGVTTYEELAVKSPDELREILKASGVTIMPTSVDTWPEQAELAVRFKGDWLKFKDLQDELISGVRPTVTESVDETAEIADHAPEPTEVEEEAPAEEAEPEVIKVVSVVEVEKSSEEPDDLTKVEGIGPAYSQRLYAQGVNTFAQLAAMSIEEITEKLEAEGTSRIPASIETWAEQAALAAKGDWDALEKLQDELDGGRRS